MSLPWKLDTAAIAFDIIGAKMLPARKAMTQEEIKAIIRQEMPEILQDREMRDYYDSSVDALGAIWEPQSE